MTPLAKAVYETLVFFDVEQMPLTLVEISNNLPGRDVERGLLAIERVLRTELVRLVRFRQGFYFLAKREKLLSLRRARYRVSLQRLFRAKRHLRGLRHLPYLRAVAISGSLCFLNSRESSDIDLFIITAKDKVWLSRIFVTLYFQIMGRRRHGRRISGRYCLNHYVAEDVIFQDDRELFTATAYSAMLTVMGHKKYQKFWERNIWLARDFFPRTWPGPVPFFGMDFSWIQKTAETFLDLSGLGPALNRFFAWYQRRRIRTFEDVVVSDNELSFHFRSHGQKVLARVRATLDRAAN